IMAQDSAIEWTDATWNPITGCTKISPGCKNCYADRMAKRLYSMRQPRYHDGFQLTLQPDLLEAPLRWKKSRMIFVNSMSDLFHKDVPDEYVLQVADVMLEARWHTYQVLTKRADRLQEMLRTSLREHAASRHIWWGVSVEDRE